MRTLLSTACLALVSLVAGPRAEAASAVNVPFSFEVQNVRMPAGSYTLQQASDSETAMLVNNRTGQRVQVLRGVRRAQPGKAKLVFERQGDTYQLARLW